MKIQVYRTSASSYQGPKFTAKEKKALEDMADIIYIQSLKDAAPEYPFILISNTHTEVEKIPPVMLENTILMLHPNSGHDNLSIEFFKNANFPIILGNPIRSNAVVEYTLSCLFKHFTPIENHHYWSNDRVWSRKLIRDQKVLILGYGHIGETLHSSLTPLVPNLKVVDPYKGKNADPKSYKDTDVLIIACDLNKKNEGMINRDILNQLSPEALIINPARGKLIDEADLKLFLQANKKAFCFLDVFEKEPFAPGYLGDLPNLNKTSHIAGVHEKLNNDIISFEYIVIKDFLESYRGHTLSQFQEEYEHCLLNENKFKI